MTEQPLILAIDQGTTSGRAIVFNLDGAVESFDSRTELLLAPYFSRTKLAWMLDEDSELRQRARRCELPFGTVDCCRR